MKSEIIAYAVFWWICIMNNRNRCMYKWCGRSNLSRLCKLSIAADFVAFFHSNLSPVFWMFPFFIWTNKNCRFHFICLHLYARISIHKMVFISSAACLFPSSSSFLIPKDLAMLLEEQLWIGFSSVCLGIKYVVCVWLY